MIMTRRENRRRKIKKNRKKKWKVSIKRKEQRKTELGTRNIWRKERNN